MDEIPAWILFASLKADWVVLAGIEIPWSLNETHMALFHVNLVKSWLGNK